MCKKGGLLTAHKSGVNLPFLGYKCLLINKNMEHSYVKIVLVCHIIETFLRHIYLILFACWSERVCILEKLRSLQKVMIIKKNRNALLNLT